MKKNIILLSISMVISVVVCIGGLEVYKNREYEQWKKSYYKKTAGLMGHLTVSSENKVLMWEYRKSGEYHNTHNHFSIKTNQFGFRDQNHALLQKPGSIRIAFVGDSVTLGLRVNYEDTYVRKFEIYANERSHDCIIETLNFGIDGYNALQIYELLRTRIIEYQPDKVVYVMNMNDFDFENSSGNKIRYFKKPNSFFLEMLETIYKRVCIRFYGKDYDTSFHLYYFNKNKQAVFQAILSMQDLLKKKGIAFQVVLLPFFHPDGDGFKNYSLTIMHREIIDFLTANQIAAFDLLERFQELHDPQSAYAYDIWHPNERGHQLIAQYLLEPVLFSHNNN